MKQVVTRGKVTQPNPQALYELEQRVLLFLAMRESKKRAEAHWIGQRRPPVLKV